MIRDSSLGDPRPLVRRCATGNDEESWSRLLERYGPRLRHGMHRALIQAGERIGREGMDDLMQEVYCRLLEHGRRALRHFRGSSEAELEAYLARLSQNVVIDHLRRKAAAKRRVSLVRFVDEGSPSCPEEAVTDPSPHGEEVLLLAELKQRFRTALMTVLAGEQARRDRHIVEAALFGGLSSAEISRQLEGSLTAGSVDSVLHRARRRFREVGLVLPSRPPSHARTDLP